LAYGPDGTWLVSGNYGDNRLRIWDTATGTVRKEIQGPAGTFRSLTLSPDGRCVAANRNAYFKDHWWVCDIASGKRLFSAEGAALAYSPDGRWLAVRDPDEKTLLLLDARTYKTAARFHGHERLIWSATFSPDSGRLASCSQDHTVRVWQIDDGAPLTLPSPPDAGGRGKSEGGRGAYQVLRGPTDEVFTAAFHPDGRRLATAGRDGVVWLWDPVRGEEVARLQGHKSYIWSVAFSPDGTTLASGSGDFTVRLWDTAPLKNRYQARRQAAALRPEAERLVEQLWREKNDPVAVVEALRADGALSEPLRHAALRAVLRRALSPQGAPGKADDPP
jgi:WD40 repeat protein